MACEQALQVQAYVDGELDAFGAAALEKHLESCAECTSLRNDLETLKSNIRGAASYYRANPVLEQRVRTTLGLSGQSARRGRNRRPFWLGAASGALAAALAASLVAALWLPSAQQIAPDVVSAHVRSLMDDRLVDIPSSNHHVVRPWFAGRADISPPADDFAKEGFALAGGRIDYVHGERAAVLVYRHGAHIVNVFVWRDDGAARAGENTLNGYHLIAWKKGNLFFCAVSDMAEAELGQLTKLIREKSSD